MGTDAHNNNPEETWQNEGWSGYEVYWGEADADWWTSDQQWYDDSAPSGYDGGDTSSGPTGICMKEAQKEEIKESNRALEAARVGAMTAGRNLAAARRAVAEHRTDRGFGKPSASASFHKGKSKGKSPGPCFICGEQGHLAAQCPDRQVPGSNLAVDGGPSISAEEAFWIGKGKGFKGKSKGSGKFSGGKGKGGKSRHYLGVIDFCPVDSSTEQGPQRHPGESLQDTGASASAGADESVKGLLASLIKIAPETLIELDSSYTGRPWFRFGNGEWGQALYKMTATSRTLYQNRYARQFTCYALPSPKRDNNDQSKTETEPTPLEQFVPVLAGMDFMSANGMITDHKMVGQYFQIIQVKDLSS